MLKTISRSLLRAPPARYAQRRQRQYSALAIYTSFPATLFRYSAKSKSALYNRTARKLGGDDIYEDAVEVLANGLVGPKASDNWASSNGALFMPNTFNMQEMIRSNFDKYVEDEEAGQTVDIPHIFTVRKGTPIPTPLILFHEFDERFTLQPSRQMPLEELNKSLDEFFAKHAEKQVAEEWFDDHDYNTAVAAEDIPAWMTK